LVNGYKPPIWYSGNDSLSGGTHVAGDTKVTDADEKSTVGFP
jgi:hypothetical protein